MLSLLEVASWCNVLCLTDTLISGISIDSRSVTPGNLFVAVCGARFDGHHFIDDAQAKGAVAVLCHEFRPDVSIPQLVVPDTVQALALIATHYRQKMQCEVIALTGSNGKTTVKEMIATILPQPSFATPGNLNNHIGAPISVLQLHSQHRYAVFELGANHIGEIAHTVAIVQPKVTLINNIAPAHIGEFGSLDDVARAKGEIYQGLSSQGTAVINADDDYAHFWDAILVDKTVLHFSMMHCSAPIHARNVRFNTDNCAVFVLVVPGGEVDIQLLVPGVHNVRNALAAAACSFALGISLTEIADGLRRFSGVPGRMAYQHGKQGALIINDTYNANLQSTLVALDVLSKRPGRRIFVFGDMGELGEWCQAHHHEVGVSARIKGIDCLMTVGQHTPETVRAFGANACHYDSHTDLIEDLLTQLDAQTTVLVKGSRSSAMEKIVQQLEPTDMPSL
jgi:UDP-N-acetylmuramoyl-tripeptide--D-alanyl-D-alanine ligase